MGDQTMSLNRRTLFKSAVGATALTFSPIALGLPRSMVIRHPLLRWVAETYSDRFEALIVLKTIVYKCWFKEGSVLKMTNGMSSDKEFMAWFRLVRNDERFISDSEGLTNHASQTALKLSKDISYACLKFYGVDA